MAGSLYPLLWREFRANFGYLGLFRQFLVPTAFLLLFGVGLSSTLGAVSYGGRTVSYLLFLVPGLMVSEIYFPFSVSMSTVRLDIVTEYISIIIVSRTRIHYYWLSKAVFAGLRGLLMAFYILLAALPLTGYAPSSLASYLVIAAVVFVSCFMWSSLGLVIGCRIRSERTRDLIMAIVNIPLTFSSSAYYDISRAPLWLRALGSLNPLTYSANIVRSAYLGVGAYSLFDIVGLAAYTIVAAVLAYISSRKITIR